MIILGLTSPRWTRLTAVSTAVALTAIGSAYNAFIHPFGPPTAAVGLVVATVALGGSLGCTYGDRRRIAPS